MKPRIGVIPGDPGGIGPELVAKVLDDPALMDRARILLIGDEPVFEMGQAQAGINHDLERVDARTDSWAAAAGTPIHDNATIDPDDIIVARVSAASGRSSLANLDLALDLATEGQIDAIVFGPFNKAALHTAGMVHADELHYMAARLGVRSFASELNVLDGLWTSRVTSHIALREVADGISKERIAEAVTLIDRTLRQWSAAAPDRGGSVESPCRRRREFRARGNRRNPSGGGGSRAAAARC